MTVKTRIERIDVDAWRVVVDGDPDHPYNTTCDTRAEAEDAIPEIEELWAEDNGQFGVGA
jgi:hypothetical protein